MNLNLRPKEECTFDEISLGEIMLRLDPGEGRIKTARSFRAWEGGGEYNVARGLRRCFGLRTSVVTAFAENEIGYLMEDLILQGGVDTSLIKWVPYDGIGRNVRNGINFTERGFGIRGAVGASDRGNTAASQIKPGDIDWDYIFVGFIQAVSMQLFLRTAQILLLKQLKKLSSTVQSYLMTLTTVRHFGRVSAVRLRRKRLIRKSQSMLTL